MMSAVINPFQLLEINVISAQDLASVTRSMRTYAMAWVHPDRKLSTRVDTHGRANPTWNDRFVFRVDDDFLRGNTSAIMIQIYALHWFRDIHVGTVRILVGNLIPPPTHPNNRHRHQPHVGMQFVALQVRRPSGRPQGILNIGVAVLDSAMRSMPLCKQLNASTLGFHDLLMSDENDNVHHYHLNHHQCYFNNDDNASEHWPQARAEKLRRTRSERSSERVSDKEFHPKSFESTITSSNDANSTQKGKKIKMRKASSLISRSGRKKVKSGINGPDVIGKVKISRVSSMINGSNVEIDKRKEKVGSIINGLDLGSIPKLESLETGEPKVLVPLKLISKGESRKVELAAQPKTVEQNGPNWAESEVGPSASEVAVAVVKAALPPPEVTDEGRSKVLDKWTLDNNMEGLQSKLERWRTNLLPLYDQGDYKSIKTPMSSTAGSSSWGTGSIRHMRRHTDGSIGLFSCFSNVYGYECSCVCGTNAPPIEKEGGSKRHLTSS